MMKKLPNSVPLDAGARALKAYPTKTTDTMTVLLLCVAMELDTSIALACARAHNDPNRPFPTFSLALSIFDEPAWDALIDRLPDAAFSRTDLGDRRRQIASVYVWVRVTFAETSSGVYFFARTPSVARKALLLAQAVWRLHPSSVSHTCITRAWGCRLAV